MTEEAIKEQLSRRFVEAIANRAGYFCNTPTLDYGVDLDVCKCSERIEHGRRRFLNTGQIIQLQLKATCEASLEVGEDGITRFDLEAKNFNDLVERREADTPLYLVLFVLPDDPLHWLTVTPDELSLKRRAYYYRPPVGTPLTQNQATKRIDLPDETVVDLDFLNACFEENFG